MNGLSSALGLRAVKDEEKKVWRLLIADAMQSSQTAKRIQRYIDSAMNFKLGLLGLSEEQLLSLREDVFSKRRPELIEASGGTARTSLARFPLEKNVLTLLSELGRKDFGRDFTRAFEPKNSILLDGPQSLAYAAEIKKNWALIDPRDPVGPPIYLVVPHINASRFIYTLLAVHANTTRTLGEVHISLLKDVSGFEFERNELFDRKVAAEPVYAIHAHGRSLEILPDLFRQLKSSFATWCPRSSASTWWSSIGSKVSVADLVLATRAAPVKKEGSSKYAVSFSLASGWTSVKLAEDTRFQGPGANWTKLLPVARRVRKGEMSIREILDFATGLSVQEAREMSEATEGRADLPLADIELSQGVLLLSAMGHWKDGTQRLTHSSDVRAPISSLPRESKRSIENFLGTSQFWPHCANFHHPEFKKLLSSFTLRARLDGNADERWLHVFIEELENEGASVRIPVPAK